MTRQEFLYKLGALLTDVTPEEREEALRFYNEYFDEAGPEEEQALLKELGSPEKVAAIIKNNVPGSSTQPRYYSPAVRSASGYTDDGASYGASQPVQAGSAQTVKNSSGTGWMIVALIVLFPVIIAVLSAGFGIMVGLMGACFGFLVGGASSAVWGIVVLVKSAFGMGWGAGTALITAGLGFLDIAVGIALLMLGLWILLWLIPALWKGVKWCWNKLMELVRGN